MGECVVSLDKCSRGWAEDPKAPIPGYNSSQQDTLTGVLDNFKRTGRYFSRLSANSWN